MAPLAAIDRATPWLTVEEVAERAQCGKGAVYAAIRAGKLGAMRLGVRKNLRIHIDWVDAWMKSLTYLVNPDAPGVHG